VNTGIDYDMRWILLVERTDSSRRLGRWCSQRNNVLWKAAKKTAVNRVYKYFLFTKPCNKTKTCGCSFITNAFCFLLLWVICTNLLLATFIPLI